MADPLSEPISKLSDALIFVATKTADFKPQLEELKATLERITPIIDEMKKLDGELDREFNIFTSVIQEAEKLVNKCAKIKWNLWKKFRHSMKLTEVNSKLLKVFQVEGQADQGRGIKQALVDLKNVKQRMDRLENLHQTLSIGSRREQVGAGKLGWRVPKLPIGIVGFEEPLKKLKAKVLADIDDGSSTDCGFDDGSVVVVSAAGGCGKTTLVKMLCNDPEIQEKFGKNLFFVTVSETPNFMVIVNDLLSSNPSGQQLHFQSNEDAKNKLESFMGERVSRPILLVLDDVWSESFINDFAFDIRRYKIVVTSRIDIRKYEVFHFDPLSDEDAKTLFCCSAFTQGKKESSPTIDNDLVNQMVKCCKKHPLTLSVIGSWLNGKQEIDWRDMLKTLSQGNSVLDLHEEILNRLERSFKHLEDKFKQCYLDFGLFPEDQRIPASAFLNMWVHLYGHDDEGINTLAKISQLSYRNLVNLLPTGNDQSAIVNYCEQQFVTQHDLLRQLAINLNSKLPEAQRERLIISAQGEDLPASIEQVQEPMKARILSISTGESFSSRWCNMKVPDVEVLVLNLMSKTYTLPHFLKEMQKLKILNVTNYGLYPTEFEKFNLLGCLTNLTKVRLEHVSVSSLSRSTLALENLQTLSLVMCKIGDAFGKLNSDNNLNVWPRLVEIEMDYCLDLVGFPEILCSIIHLKKLSITNCNEMCELSEEFGKLTSLETLSLRSCTKLEKLPDSLTRLQKLSILDISDCLSLSKLPEQIGKVGGLRTIYMKGCTGVHELPTSVKELSYTKVVCNEELSYQWKEFPNVKINVVEEDRLKALLRITGYSHF